jgi:transketolase
MTHCGMVARRATQWLTNVYAILRGGTAMVNKSQRDSFFEQLYLLAKADRNVVVVSADMSAPALDQFRRDLPAQFVNVGIAEQNAIVVAAGLAFEGKRVFVYAIAPFITLRCLEQIRVCNGINEIPITIVGMGTGLSYCSDGPTHHLIEDIATMRAIPGVEIVSVTDNVMAAAYANKMTGKASRYLRIDKDFYSDVYQENFDFNVGFSRVKQGEDNVIVTCGPMVHTALKIVALPQFSHLNIGVIDLFRFPIDQKFIAALSRAKKVITLEEHFLPGGMGSGICEIFSDNGITIPVKRLGLSNEHGYAMSYKYGGRDILRNSYGIGDEDIKKTIGDFFK